MKFLYIRDPLFISCLIMYWLNRWVLKPLTTGGIFHTSLNDLMCIQFWVPLMLWGMRRFGLRSDDRPPQWYGILIPLVWWSFIFEWWIPRSAPFRGLTVSDPYDIVSYAVGALVAALFWHWRYRERATIDALTSHESNPVI